jgi:hypothetical protein
MDVNPVNFGEKTEENLRPKLVGIVKPSGDAISSGTS